MDVDKLEEMLKELIGEQDVKPWIKIIAHWTKKIKKDETYTTKDEGEIKTLKKLQDMRIFDVSFSDGEARASLTKEGDELSKDFFKKGYYL